MPLRIFEDRQLLLPAGSDRETWLSEWHTDVEWLGALHRTTYSNGLIGLYEEVARHSNGQLDTDETKPGSDEYLNRRFIKRQRELVETDLLIVANNHWNFDVRGFNPGGNHGSFFRVSTQSTFMLAGGDKTQLPRGAVVEEPYDSLSFMPTMLALTGNLRDDRIPLPVLWNKGFRKFPGRIVKEILPGLRNQRVVITGAVVFALMVSEGELSQSGRTPSWKNCVEDPEPSGPSGSRLRSSGSRVWPSCWELHCSRM